METCNKSKRKKINSEKVISFSNRKYYRYVYIPDKPTSDFDIMTLFFGDDRSYRLGCPFDDGDIIFEFVFKDSNSGLHIDHHPLSYRGSLDRLNITITNIFINKRNEDYYLVHHLIAYRNKIKNLIKNLNNEYQSKINYFDILRERINFKKIPKTGWWQDKWKGLIYDAVLTYI